MSASIKPTLSFDFLTAIARFEATVDFPTPPLRSYRINIIDSDLVDFWSFLS